MDKWEGAQLNTAKEILAFELTQLVHGTEEARKAQDAARALFSTGGDKSNMPRHCPDRDRPHRRGHRRAGPDAQVRLVPSKKEARRLIEQGGVELDGQKSHRRGPPPSPPASSPARASPSRRARRSFTGVAVRTIQPGGAELRPVLNPRGRDMTDWNAWLEEYQSMALGLFGERVRFLGLQGSRARGEAGPGQRHRRGAGAGPAGAGGPGGLPPGAGGPAGSGAGVRLLLRGGGAPKLGQGGPLPVLVRYRSPAGAAGGDFPPPPTGRTPGGPPWPGPVPSTTCASTIPSTAGTRRCCARRARAPALPSRPPILPAPGSTSAAGGSGRRPGRGGRPPCGPPSAWERDPDVRTAALLRWCGGILRAFGPSQR